MLSNNILVLENLSVLSFFRQGSDFPNINQRTKLEYQEIFNVYKTVNWLCETKRTIYIYIYIRLKIKPNSVRIRF